MMTGPPTQAALLVSACIALCKSQPEKSEAFPFRKFHPVGIRAVRSLPRPLHHQRRPARTTHRAIWDHRHHTNLVRIASLLRADIIFGKDNGSVFDSQSLIERTRVCEHSPSAELNDGLTRLHNAAVWAPRQRAVDGGGLSRRRERRR